MRRNVLFGVFLISIVLLFANCKKYEEGPAFSLSSKKARLTGEWLLKEVNAQPDINDQYWNFDKTGDYSIRYGTTPNVNPALWNFDDKKERIEIYYLNSDTYDYFTILRLSSKELWIDLEVGSVLYQYKLEKAE